MGKRRSAGKMYQHKRGYDSLIFYEGPPTANGKPGIHHVIARTLKDSVCRYKTMQGYEVTRKAGWDTHGLPVEIEVEKQHGCPANRTSKNTDQRIQRKVQRIRIHVRKHVARHDQADGIPHRLDSIQSHAGQRLT